MKKKMLLFVYFVIIFYFTVLESPLSAEVLAPNADKAQQASAGEIAGDLLIIRPVCLGLTVIGAGVLIVAAPFTLAGQNFRRSAEVLFIEPAMYTFGYPLGSY